MARPDSAIGTTEAVERLVVVKQCPITCGCPTQMTEEGFAALCRTHQGSGKTWKYSRAHSSERDGWCQRCRGERRPEELTIVSADQMGCGAVVTRQIEVKKSQRGQTMATKKVRGYCEGGCETNGSLVAENYGVQMCSTCATVYSHVKNRKETVLAAIKRTELEQWYLMELAGETVAATGESVALKSISNLVGYAGESPDELIEEVKKVVADRDFLSGQVKSNGDKLEEMLNVFAAIRSELAEADSSWLASPWNDFPVAIAGIICDARRLTALLIESKEAEGKLELLRDRLYPAVDDVVRHLGMQECDEFDHLAIAVAQGEAILDSLAETVGVVEHMQIIAAVAQLVATYERLRQRNDALQAENSSLADRVSVLERANLTNEQIFARLRELVDADGLANAELPSAISSVMYATEQWPVQPSIDGHLLDLALDAWSGRVTGLDPDRIGVLREAAR